MKTEKNGSYYELPFFYEKNTDIDKALKILHHNLLLTMPRAGTTTVFRIDSLAYYDSIALFRNYLI